MSNIYTDIMDAIETLLDNDATTREYERYRTLNPNAILSFPAINILYAGDKEKPTTIQSKKDIMIQIIIECYSQDIESDSGNNEAIDVATNVKRILRGTPKLGLDGVLDSNSVSTENKIGVSTDMYVNIVAITFDVWKRITR